MIEFRILFTLRLLHDYYGGACRDFQFLFPADTQKLVQHGRLVPRVRDGVLTVFHEVGEDSSALRPLQGRHVRLGLKLQNPYFTNFTNLPFDVRRVTPFYRNTGAPAALDAPLETKLVGHVIAHALGDTERPVALALKNSEGQALSLPDMPNIITAAHVLDTVSFNLTGQEAGLYTVEEQYPASTITRPYYSDAELAGQGVFGIVDIQIANSFYATPPAFEISFAAKQETLKYYLVAHNYSDAEMAQLSVNDAGFADAGRSEVQFSKLGMAAWTAADLSPTLLNDGNSSLLLFRSQAPVSRQEQARKKIQLRKNGEVLIAHLPQPGADHVGSDLVVHVSKP